MYFNSYTFILAFLPVTVIGYFLLNKLKNRIFGKLWLLAASVFFYLCYSVPMSLVLLGSLAVNYLLFRLIRKNRSAGADKAAKTCCAIGVVFNVLLLFVFKYAVTCAGLIATVLHTDPIISSIVVPVGISFFTFSQISFLIDTCRGEAPDCSALDYALYVLLFIKILSGPIVSADKLIPQYHDESRKHFQSDNFAKGIYAFTFGLAKKVLIADFLDIITSACFGSIATCSGIEAVAAILGYSLQIYFDFSGYCDMAAGVGMMLNIDLPFNFDSPYKATSIVDFWKRWHITLTAFLTKYIYYPLGGNRKGKARQYLNILIVFLVSGIWHGAGFTFIIWGLMHGILSILTRVAKPVIEKIPKFISTFVTFLLVTVSWVFFRATTVSSALKLLAKPFTVPFGSFNEDLAEAMRQPMWFSIANKVLPINIALAAFLLFCLFAVFFMKNTRERVERFRPTVARSLITVVLLTASMLLMTGFASFIYGGF